jgi:hypothetical protein
MDPDAALDDLINEVLLENFLSAREALDALEEWCDNGGFQPNDPRPVAKEFNTIAWHRGA